MESDQREERREVVSVPLPLVPSITEEEAAAPQVPLPKRKITHELIKDPGTRRSVYRKRREGLLKKMNEITTLCGINACIIIYGPGDKQPLMWPSPEVTQQLLIRYHGLPELDRFKNVVTQRSFMLEKTRKMEAELNKINERNNEREMLIFIHQIYKEGKPLSDFHVRDLERLLAYVEGKTKKQNAPNRIDHPVVVEPSLLPSSSSLPLVPISCSSLPPNVVVEEQVSEQQPFLNLVNEVDHMNNVFDTSNVSLQPHTYVGDVSGFNSISDSGNILPPGYFGGFNGNNDYLGMLSQSNIGGFSAESNHSGLELLPQATFGGFNNVDNDHLDILLSQGNFGGFNEESVPSGLEALPQANFGDLNGLSDQYLSVLPQGNFGSFNVESGYSGLEMLPQGNFGDNSGSLPQGNFFGLNDQRDHSWVLPELSFGGQYVESDLGMSLPPGNFIGESSSGNLHGSFTGEIGSSALWNSYGQFGSTISESDMRLANNNSEGNIGRGF